MTAPRGWDIVRLPAPAQEEEVADDLEALANAVREAARPLSPREPTGQGVEVGRRGHLRVLRSAPAGAAPSGPAQSGPVKPAQPPFGSPPPEPTA